MIVKIVNSSKEMDDAYSVRHKVFVEEQQVPIDLEMDEFEESAIHVVLYDGEQPVGAGRARVLEDCLKVERICVLHSYRSKGCGRLLMEKTEEIARIKNIKKVKLNAQTHAEGFYSKIGFETISDVFMDAGIPHVTMIKNIISPIQN